MLTLPVGAVDVPTLYTTEVPYDREAEDARADAYEAALKTVLLRVSGSDLANAPEVIEELFPNPASYVMQFRAGANDTLWVSFDGEAIEQTLRNAGQSVWGSDRPLTLAWLAVDWGRASAKSSGRMIPTGPGQSPVRSIATGLCASASSTSPNDAACPSCFRCWTRRTCRW